MKNKIKIAFIKYNGLLQYGTEIWFKNVAARIDKSKFDVDFFYTGTAEASRLNFLIKNNVNVIKVNLSGVDRLTGEWLDTDLFDKFDEKQYDIIQTAIAGDAAWPFYTFKTAPVVHSIHIDRAADMSDCYWHQFFLSEWLLNKNARLGGIKKLGTVVPLGANMPFSGENLREELGIQKDKIVIGFHQRPDDGIYSDIPLKAFSKVQDRNCVFIILGGSKKYSLQAQKLKLENFIQLEATSDLEYVSKFLNTLDIFAHGRHDGETFGYVFMEALLHKLPCIGHYSFSANAHKDTIGRGGYFVYTVGQYKNKLKLLIENESLRKEIAQRGFDEAKHKYIDTDYVKIVENVYEDIVNNKEQRKKELRKLQKIRDIKEHFAMFSRKKLGDKRIFIILGFKFIIKKKKKR